jgi:transketolase
MTLSDSETKELIEMAAKIRCGIVDVTGWAGGSHIGGALSQTDILTLLYFKYLNVDPSNPDWDDRDRFVLSKGHGGVSHVVVLANKGYFDPEILKNYGKEGSPFSMHMNANKVPGVDISTGSLGHGLPQAVGLALGARIRKKSWITYCLMGDGECHEGSIWEAAMAASHYKLNNLIGIVDRNGLCVDGPTEEVMSLEPFADKWTAFGWKVKTVDGHSFPELAASLDFAIDYKEGPVLIIANTVKGKGYSFIENDPSWHYGALDSNRRAEAKKSIRGEKSE